MRHDHTTLSGSQVHSRIKAEADGVAFVTLLRVAFADRMPLVVRTDCMRGIFNYKQSLLARKTPNGIHITRQAGNMHGYNGSCSIRDFLCDAIGINVAVFADIR